MYRQKTGREFSTFISFEAVESIKTYLKTERRGYTPDDFLFSNFYQNKQLTADLVQKDFRVLNERLNNKQKELGAYRVITSHMLRKFFNTQLTNANITYEIRKHMMGHVLPNKVDNSYYLENPDELFDAYLKHIGVLTINPTKTITLESKEYAEIIAQNQQLKEEMLQLKEEKIDKDILLADPEFLGALSKKLLKTE